MHLSLGKAKGLCNVFADRREYYLCAEARHNAPSFLAHAGGHHNRALVAFYCRDQSQTYALVAAREFHDDGIGL